MKRDSKSTCFPVCWGDSAVSLAADAENRDKDGKKGGEKRHM